MRKKVVIVGGGLAGLTAAYKLSQHETDFEVVVLEATDRIGGRVFTTVIDGQKVDVGGFIVFPFYKYFKALLKELHLKKDLTKISKNEFFRLRGSDAWLSDKTISYTRLFPFKFLVLVCREFLRKKTLPSIYRPNFSVFDGKSLFEVLQDAKISHDTIALYEAIISGYTYAPSKELPATLFVPVGIQLLLHGMFNRCTRLKHGATTLTNVLKNKIESNGGTIMCNSKVHTIRDGKAHLKNGDVIPYDRLIVASQEAAGQVADESLLSRTSHTSFDFVVAKMRDSVVVNGEHDWFIGYVSEAEETKLQSHFTSFVLLSSCSNLALNYLGGLLTWPKDTNPSNVEGTKERAIRLIHESFRDSKVEEISYIHRWNITMPSLTITQLANIHSLQGKDNIWFAGDYLTFPSMETAVYTGMCVANEVINS